jgi:hypothetical protein
VWGGILLGETRQATADGRAPGRSRNQEVVGEVGANFHHTLRAFPLNFAPPNILFGIIPPTLLPRPHCDALCQKVDINHAWAKESFRSSSSGSHLNHVSITIHHHQPLRVCGKRLGNVPKATRRMFLTWKQQP